MLTDREILALLKARSEVAIDALAARFERLCHRIAMNILSCEADAEECTNDTYLAVWNTVPPHEPDPLTPYVGRLARNTALDRYRYNHAERRYSGGEVLLSELEEIVSGTDCAEDDAMRGALAEAISAFLHAQSEEDRWLFVRRYWYGDGIDTLAQALHGRKNSISVRLHRLRERLRAYLIEEGFSI